MSQPKQQLTRAVWIVSIMLMVVGCGSTASEKESAASATTAVISTTSTTTSTSTSPSSNGTYQTKIFRPAFSVDLPSGWTVVERDAAAAQIFVPCDACEHGGEENGEITLDMTLGKVSPEEAIAKLRGASNAESQPAAPAHVGSLDGFKFTATRTGAGEVKFADIGYHTEADGEPIDVMAMDVGGRTVTIFMDPHVATGPAAQEFATVAAEILKSIQFAS